MEPPDIPDLCRRLVDQLDNETRGDLRLLVLMVAMASDKGHSVEVPLGEMYNRLEPKKG